MTGDGSRGLDELRDLLGERSLNRRAFILRALDLGLSVAAAYALLGEAAPAKAAVTPSSDLAALDQQLAGHPSGKVVSPQDEPAAGVRERIERLRERYAGDQPGADPKADSAPSATPDDSRPLRSQLAQDWDNWNNWSNWDNWDNWSNWDNWNNWDNWDNWNNG